MSGFEATVSRDEIDAALRRLAEAPSVVTDQRACVGFSGGGRALDVRGRAGFGRRWTGSAVPWWLSPLRLIAAGDRSLVEVIEGQRVLTLAEEADPCFILAIYSFSRARLDAVFEHMRSGGVTTDPGEVIDQDSSFLELEVWCDGGSHGTWHASVRTGTDCPEDLVRAVEELDEDGE